MNNCLRTVSLLTTLLLTIDRVAYAAEMPGTILAALTDVQKYERAIHIMAMLLVGFGFLMVFVKKYGRSALTATYLLGSMVLWVFWPSFCAALVAPADVPKTAVNVILALCGSTLATYFASVKLRGKISAADIANAALAGGVAIGSTCNHAIPGTAFTIGILAGAVSTFGFAAIQAKLTNLTKKVDTCGVFYLHGLPGLLGGIVALVVVSGINFGAQLTGILVTIIIAAGAGLISGKVIAVLGSRSNPYVDIEEFEG